MAISLILRSAWSFIPLFSSFALAPSSRSIRTSAFVVFPPSAFMVFAASARDKPVVARSSISKILSPGVRMPSILFCLPWRRSPFLMYRKGFFVL